MSKRIWFPIIFFLLITFTMRRPTSTYLLVKLDLTVILAIRYLDDRLDRHEHDMVFVGTIDQVLDTIINSNLCLEWYQVLDLCPAIPRHELVVTCCSDFASTQSRHLVNLLFCSPDKLRPVAHGRVLDEHI